MTRTNINSENHDMLTKTSCAALTISIQRRPDLRLLLAVKVGAVSAQGIAGKTPVVRIRGTGPAANLECWIMELVTVRAVLEDFLEASGVLSQQKLEMKGVGIEVNS